ncbi:hypothetical protein Tco_0785203 [Tanacetum coccineum]
MKDSLKHSLESNLKRIQLKDIVKKVEDYLKTYLSAGMDISWYVDGIHLRFKERNNNRVENAFETNNANNNGTNNATTNVVGEDLPQLLDYWVAHFLQKDCPTTKTSSPSYPSSNKIHNKTKFRTNSFSSSHQHNQTVDNVQKDYKVRYKALKVELDLLTQKIETTSKQKSEKGLVDESFNWDEKSLSSEDEGTTTVKAFMAIAEDDPIKFLATYFVPWVEEANEKTCSSQDVVFIKDEDSPIENSPECAFDTKSVNDNHDPVPPLPKLSRTDPFGTPKGVTSIDLAQTYIVSDKTKKCSICQSDDHLTKEHPKHVAVKKTLTQLRAQTPQIKSTQEFTEKIELWEFIRNMVNIWEGETMILGLMALFPQLSTMCLDRDLSYHHPILMREMKLDYDHTSFKIFHSWFKMEGFDKTVEDTWKRMNIKELNSLIQLNKKLQYKMLDQGGYNDATLNQRSTLMKELHDLYSIKALEDAQKAKVQWFIEVDGEWLAYPSKVKSEFLKHFENRFSKLESSRITLDYHFPNRLSFEKTKELKRNVSYDDIKRVVWDCGMNKSPVAHGFSFELFYILKITVPDNQFACNKSIKVDTGLYRVHALTKDHEGNKIQYAVSRRRQF